MNELHLTLRDAVFCKADGQYRERSRQVQLPARKTGVILCDMWDRHWCRSATERVQELAPRIDQTVRHLRSLGAQIVHCPSDTMDFYAEAPQRQQTLRLAKGVELTLSPEGAARVAAEPELPIDRSHVECDCGIVKCSWERAWTKECSEISLASEDWIGDSVELLRAFQNTGIQTVLLMGVHTNMCILNRDFGVRNLLKYGFQPILVRDLTDCMAPSEEEPFRNHFTALDYVIWHIEKNLCPTVDSGQILRDGQVFRFRQDHREVVPSGREMDQILEAWRNTSSTSVNTGEK